MIEYAEREKIKEEAWEMFRKAETPHGKAAAILKVIDCHYWRAREDIEAHPKSDSLLKKIFPKKFSPGYEMDIDHYTPHWLYANRKLVPDEVMKALEDNWGYKPMKSEFLSEGHTMYFMNEKRREVFEHFSKMKENKVFDHSPETIAVVDKLLNQLKEHDAQTSTSPTSS